MTHLFLADLAAMTEDEVKEHIADNYAGSVSGFDYGSPSTEEMDSLREKLSGYDILVAYESVGSWGCDSSSWFLIRDKATGKLMESHGGHCSCYGFEGQWEAVTIEHMLSDKFYLPTGGYDDSGTANESAVREFIKTLS